MDNCQVILYPGAASKENCWLSISPVWKRGPFIFHGSVLTLQINKSKIEIGSRGEKCIFQACQSETGWKKQDWFLETRHRGWNSLDYHNLFSFSNRICVVFVSGVFNASRNVKFWPFKANILIMQFTPKGGAIRGLRL